MQKLFYEDQYMKDFTAEVLNVKVIDDKFHVLLDKTAFFPGGGGQPCDLGFIEDHKVIDVYEEEDNIYHVLEKKPVKIHRVKCSIDWNRRIDGMQQHLGQHVLSGCFFKLFGKNTVGFHLGEEISTVDIESYLSENEIRKAEVLANNIIEEDLKVEFSFPSKSELKHINLRRALPKTDAPIRVVTIEDLDVNACCGVHPNSTLELRLIKIRRWEKHKNSTRIEFLSGRRAIEDSFKKDKFASELCTYLSANEEEAINAINNLSTELKNSINTNKKLKSELQTYQVKELIQNSIKIGKYTLIKEIFFDDDIKYISKLTSKLVENEDTIALMIVPSEEKANLIFACSKDMEKLNMNELLKDSISLIDGKGGGSKVLAQGAGKNNNNLQGVIDYAFMKIKNTLS
ncbi:alanyl-tRNA editing protein [Hathewaya massiliensis]|uniref:alanyl-tRNA editing protein n=1 Tax=Hathewaya massiliensis TaxID=1964382 RepID=UPI0011580008|nr:DHHA1 domain-containing protein [Hathewaya massiliensis]